jgi:hypothetical protein
MTISLKTRLKVSSVSSVEGPDGKENIKISFVEEHIRPPPVAVMPQSAPKEISNVVFQVQKGIQSVLPKGLAKLQKIVLVFTPEELEAFHIKPYPNQTYEVTISDGCLRFMEV